MNTHHSLFFILSLICSIGCYGDEKGYPDTTVVRGMVLSSPFDIENAREIDSTIIYDERYVVFAPVVIPPPEIIIKYAEKIGVEPSQLKNEKIYEFIDQWIGTRYRYGGSSKRGIDCSALTRALHNDVSHILLPRSSREMYRCNMIQHIEGAKKDISLLREGDLVFFRRRGYIFHVGVYLCAGKFLSANRTGGVGISNLTTGYWGRYYYAAARLKTPTTTEEKILN